MCKTKYLVDCIEDKKDAGLVGPRVNIFTLKVRKDKQTKFISMRICPECAEKLLELLDKHFPRLNLEDEL